MKRYLDYRSGLRAFVPAALLLAFAVPTGAAQTANASPNPSQVPSQDHIVSSQTLQQQVESSTAQRQQNIDTLDRMLKLPEAQKAMHQAKVSPEQVKQAIPTLSDAELSDLSARARTAQEQFSAGSIGEGELIIICLIIVVIVVVVAVH